MARGRVYKSEVKTARDALLRQGTNPSLDAVRIALGNTGSKTTIHRLMRELETEEAEATPRNGEAISDALQGLVGQLAAQLREEAESIVAAGQAEAAAKVAAAREDVARLTQQGQDASAQIQRLQTTLDEVRQALTASERGARDRDTTIVGLNERIAGLERQLGEREAHLMSAETKHQQARDALEHFRQASREQRDTEARQHEQAVQALQVELRRATDTVASKNDELLSLNRANARYTEQVGQLDKELRDTRRTLQTAQTRVAEAEALRQANQALEQRVSQLTVDIEAMRREQTTAHMQWDGERAALADALREARDQGERWGTIEAMLSNLQPTSPAIDGSSS